MSMQSRRPDFRIIGILGAIFLLFVYLLVIRPHFGFVKVTLYLETDHAGVMEIFPPLKKVGYSQQNARTIGFPRGESGHIVSIHYSKAKAALRLDPTVRKGRVTINKMSVEHLGITKTLSGADFEAYVVSCDQAICETSADGLLVESTDVDSKVMLRPGLVPLLSSPGLTLFITCIILLLLLAIAILRYLLPRVESVSGVVLVRVVLVYLLLFYFINGVAPVFGAILHLLMLMLVTVFVYISRSKIKLMKAYNIDGLMLLFCAGLIILFGFSQSFTAAFIEDIQQHLSDQSDEESAEVNAVQNVRASIEGLYTKHFYAKDKYINLDAKVKIFGLGFTPNTKSILGQDGWYFEGYGGRRVEQEVIKSYDNITDYMGLMPFTSAELAQWNVVLEERYYWLKERGIDYVFALAPTKALVYPEKLPARIYNLKNRLKHETRYDQLVKYLKQHSSVPVVDLRSGLSSAKDAHPWPLFYRTDFHWNYLGAYYAYKAIMEALNERFPEHQLPTLGLEEFRIEPNYEWAHHNFLSLAGLIPAEHRDDTYLKLFPENTARYEAGSAFYERGIFDGTMPEMNVIEFGDKTRAAIRALKNSKGEIDSIFIIGDSFSEKMVGYFSAHARTVYNYRTVSRFLTAPIERYKPEIVIQEILNMYILGVPPVNPPELKAARMKHLKNADQQSPGKNES